MSLSKKPYKLVERLRDVNQVIYPVCNEAANEIVRLRNAILIISYTSTDDSDRKYCKEVLDNNP